MKISKLFKKIEKFFDIDGDDKKIIKKKREKLLSDIDKKISSIKEKIKKVNSKKKKEEFKKELEVLVILKKKI